MEQVFILDGATGTNLQVRGLNADGCVEKAILEQPDILVSLQQDYKNAGSCGVYAATFGASRIKLSGAFPAGETAAVNRKLTALSRRAVGDICVGGGLSPTGKLLAPMGDLSFDELIAVYSEQVDGILEAGADFFVIETMMDIKEALAALYAVKSRTSLSCFVTMTFAENGRTLTGTDAVTALLTLQEKGAAAVGANCSTGPDKMAEIIKQMAPYALVPLIAKPNAGLPEMVDGSAVYRVAPDEFCRYTKEFVENGAYLLGGCCGTTPAHIEALSTLCGDNWCISYDLSTVLAQHRGEFVDAVTSTRKTVFLENAEISPAVSIDSDPDDLFDYAMDYDVIHIDLSGANVDNLAAQLEECTNLVQTPFVFSGGTDAVRAIVQKYYPGRTKWL